ncbi:MAG: exosortase/archaeosortase family protein [Planctomycetaceae bacterium]|nr:exosortase/archaeosortase family protein [Planctomycetaceae bacterium]
MKSRLVTAVAVWLVTVTCLWAYWPAFVEIADKWDRRPEYSHGWMVVMFSLFLLWSRRGMLQGNDPQAESIGTLLLGIGGLAWIGPWVLQSSGAWVSTVQWLGIGLAPLGFSLLVASWIGEEDVRPSWLGLPLLLLAAGGRILAADYYYEWFDFLSLIPFIAGLVLLLGGWRILNWSWLAILFLFFMIPLPFTFEVALRDPLQRIGTLASTFVMQTMGLPAFSEGNRVIVNDVPINVSEACSGLRMMMVFFALSVGLAIVLDRPAWQRLLIAASAIPIALITNITRITTTGLLYVWGYNQLAEDVFHDFAGWLMPPMGLALLWLELWYLDHLFIVDEKKPMRFGMQNRVDVSRATAN